MKKSKTDRQNNGLPDSNPAAAARRRMIRALGGSGAVALTSLAIKGWQKPVVRTAVVPAHAQASGCTIGVTLQLNEFNNVSSTIEGCIEVFGPQGSTGLGCVTQTVTYPIIPASLSGIINAVPGTYTVAFIHHYISGGNAISIQCCDSPIFSEDLEYIDGGTERNEYILIVDDGQCNLPTFGP